MTDLDRSDQMISLSNLHFQDITHCRAPQLLPEARSSDPRTVSHQVTPGAAAVQKQLQTSHQNPQPLLDNNQQHNIPFNQMLPTK